jgi:hypothetical protein
MGLCAMLSIDLEAGVTADRRTEFNKQMAEKLWAKIPNVTTTWRATFTDGTTESSAIQTTRIDVAAAARTAGISKYHAVVEVGPSNPTEFSN